MDGFISGVELGELIDCTPSNVKAFEKQGIFARGVEGYPLRKSLNAYISHLKAERKSRTVASQRDALMNEQTRKLKMENDAKAGLICEVDAVIDVGKTIVGTIQSELSNLPRRISREERIVSLLETEVVGIFQRVKVASTKAIDEIFASPEEEDKTPAQLLEEELDEELS